jgi:hypothetical protein
MTIEFTTDDQIIRTTGELTYSTAVVATADGKGWLLRETLQSENGKPACSGMSSDQVIAHLQYDAYVEIEGSSLRYHRTKGAKQIMEFVRADSMQRVLADRTKPASR